MSNPSGYALQDTKDFAAFLGRRSPKQAWVSRCLCTALLLLFVVPIVMLTTGYGTDRMLANVRNRKAANRASRHLGNRTLGLPFSREGRHIDIFGENFTLSEVHDNEEDGAFSNTVSAERAANQMHAIVQHACDKYATIPLDGAEHPSCAAWLDGGLMMHYITKGRTSIERPTSPLALGVHAETYAHVARFLREDMDKSLVTDSLLRVALTDNEVFAGAGRTPYIVYNDAVVVMLFVYNSHNATHYDLKWPAGHARCLVCEHDSITLSKAWYEGAQSCAGWPDDNTFWENTCVANSTDYLGVWTGDERWVETHMQGGFDLKRMNTSTRYVNVKSPYSTLGSFVFSEYLHRAVHQKYKLKFTKTHTKHRTAFSSLLNITAMVCVAILAAIVLLVVVSVLRKERPVKAD